MSAAPKLPIPEAALEQHLIALGKTRSGKSAKLRVLVEHLLTEEKPVSIIDPKGDWWGLKSSADGKGPGFPIVIFGGEHADVPLNEHAGAHIAELVATGNRPCLIDVSELMVGERTRFFVRYAEALYHAKYVGHQVIDEVHEFAPKGKVLDPDSGKALHWANRFASAGQGRGLILLAASQRPQKVHNDFLTSCETLIACRVVHPADRDAVGDWMKGCADAKVGEKILTELAEMQRADSWVWSPEIKFGPERITWPMFKTFDSFKPRGEQPKQLAGWASVDLDDVRTKLAAVVAEHEANDPKLLHKEIRDLRRQLEERAPAGASEDEIRGAVELAEAEAEQRGRDAVRDEAKAHIDDLRERARGPIEELAALFGAGIEIGGDVEIVTATRVFGDGPNQARIAMPRRVAPHPADMHNPHDGPAGPGYRLDPVKVAADGDGELTGPQRRILGALAWWEAVGVPQPIDPAVAFMANYSPSTNMYQKALGQLRTKGLIDYPVPGTRVRTDAGRAASPTVERPRTRQALHAAVLEHMTGPQRRILEPLLAAYPHELPLEKLASAAGYEESTNMFQKARGQLRSLGLIEYPGARRNVAADFLFPKGLR